MTQGEIAPTVPRDRRALVAIDLGAESCRVSLLRFDPAGKPWVELLHRFENHAVPRPDGLHWDIDAILTGLHRGLELCAAQAPEGIRSIAVDGWAVDYVRLTPGTGEAVGDPFCYRDLRIARGEQALHQRISADRMREITGIQILPLNTVYQMASEPEAALKLRWLNLPEYVLHTLGARPVSEFTNATHTQMLGLDGTWSIEILAALGAPAGSMPELVPPGTEVGVLTCPSLCRLPAFAATRLVVPACHDTASAIASIPDGGDDWAYISSGTWSLVGTLLTQPINTPEACTENFSNLGGVDGMTCFHKNVNGMWLLRQCLETWNSHEESKEKLTIGSLIEAAAHYGPPDYVLEVDHPELLLSGRMPQRINAQLRARGLREFSVSAKDAPELAAFLFHSLAARYAEVLKKITAITGRRLRRLYVLGGGSRNELLNRLTSAATGLVVVPAGAEGSTVGNFASQLATLEVSPGARPTARWASLLCPRREDV